jgi:DNA-binding GntR family transcriptional regulator
MLDAIEPFAFSAGNHAFHDAILERCPNPDLRAIVARETDRFDAMRRTIYFPLFMPSRALASVDEHETLVDLLEQRADPVEIEQFAREHKLRLGERIREFAADLTRSSGAVEEGSAPTSAAPTGAPGAR